MRFVIGCMFLILFAIFAQGTCYAEDFSADIVTVSPQGVFSAKMYVANDKSRTEVEGTATIARMDKKVVWVLIPAQKMYMEQPLDMRTAVNTREKIEGEIERKLEGQDTVSGRPATKYRVTYDVGGKRESVYRWIDNAQRIPLKTAALDGSWSSEFKNVRTGPQDPRLFEIPAGYNKMSMSMPDMGDIMKNMAE